MPLRPHQEDALKRMHNGCVLVGVVGSGKSRVAIQYYVENEAPKDIYIITTAKKRDTLDWQREAAHYAIGPDVSFYGKLTIDSWNNIPKYSEVRDAFFILDEQRLVGSGVWTKSFLKIAKANRWILLSATPGDTWLDYIPVFVANGFYPNRTAFKREHVVYSSYARFPKVERILGVRKLVELRRRILVEMPFERHTTRHFNYVEVGYDEGLHDQVWKRRWHAYEGRPLKDVGEQYRVARKVVNSSAERLEQTLGLIETHDRLVIFYTFNYELEILRTLASVVPIAEWNGHKHEAIPDTEQWVYLVQYTSGAEGWECITANAMLFYSLTYSYRLFEQAQGRIDRMNTPFRDLWYYAFRSKAPIDKMISLALDRKQDFHEKRTMW